MKTFSAKSIIAGKLIIIFVFCLIIIIYGIIRSGFKNEVIATVYKITGYVPRQISYLPSISNTNLLHKTTYIMNNTPVQMGLMASNAPVSYSIESYAKHFKSQGYNVYHASGLTSGFCFSQKEDKIIQIT